MFGILSRLREPLSREGRASFAQTTVLSCIVGVIRGLSLVAFIPAAIALTSSGPAWGLSLRAWIVVLALCAVASFIVEYLLAITSYSVAFDFLTNMHRAIGDKVASLPLGSFRPDTAGKTSRLVSRELMVLGEVFAHMYSPFVASILTSLTMLVGITVFSLSSGWRAWPPSRSSSVACTSPDTSFARAPPSRNLPPGSSRTASSSSRPSRGLSGRAGAPPPSNPSSTRKIPTGPRPAAASSVRRSARSLMGWQRKWSLSPSSAR